ncbi:MAG: hypothetical protein U0136_15480 [Bdellovibrionota bacterium]
MKSCVSRLSVCLLATSALLAVPVLPAVPAFADGAFHWKDSRGNDHYGTNPPKDASSVQSLSGNRVSRYSSDRLLKHAQGGVVSETDIKNKMFSEATNPTPVRTITKGQKPAAAVTQVPQIKEEPLIPELTQGDLTVKHDAQKRVTDCSVVVANRASIPAQNVLVSFEFEDGTLVPGVGPASIDADSTAKYSIPQEMLPIAVQGKDPADPKGPRPKVSIKAGAE